MQVKDGATVPGELGYLEPSRDHEPLIIVAAMTQMDADGRTKAVIANPTNYPRVLKAGAQLGEYHCLENASYVMSTVTLDDSADLPIKLACGAAGGPRISLEESCASPEGKQRLQALLDEFSDCFDDGGSAFTYDQGLPPHEIDTGNHRPIKCKVRRMSPAMREAEIAEINKLKARGIVRDSNSQWGFQWSWCPRRLEVTACASITVPSTRSRFETATPFLTSKTVLMLYLACSSLPPWTRSRDSGRCPCTPIM